MYPKNRLSRLALVVLVTAFAGSGPASAQSCSQLQSGLDSLKYKVAHMFMDNPGSTIVWGMCSSSAADDYNKSGSAASALGIYTVCAATACMFTDSFGNCFSVQRDLFSQVLQAVELQKRMAAHSC